MCVGVRTSICECVQSTQENSFLIPAPVSVSRGSVRYCIRLVFFFYFSYPSLGNLATQQRACLEWWASVPGKMKSTDNDLDNRRWQSAVDDFSGGGREREGEREGQRWRLLIQ